MSSAHSEPGWRAMRRWGQLLGGASLLASVAACTALGAPSKVRAGELYVSGAAKYDAYFVEVHAQQVEAAAWPSERKRARKPLVDALKLPEEPDDATLLQTTKDRMGGGTLRLEVKGSEARVVSASAARQDDPHDLIVGVEQAAQAETARAKKLGELPSRLDDLVKAGHALEAHLGEDFGGEGHKPFDVREELYVSYDALRAIASAAKTERQVAEQFVGELGHAVSNGSEGTPIAPPKEKPTKPHAPAKAPKPEEPAKPARTPCPEPTTPPKPPTPPPASKPAEHTEEFNP